MWFVWALVCTLGWGCADLFYKKGSDENDRYSHLKTACWVGLVMGVVSLILIPFSDGGLAVLKPTNIVAYLPASLSYILSMVIGYAGMRYLEISIISPVQNASGALSAIVMTVWFAIMSGNLAESFTEATGFSLSCEENIDFFNNILIAGGIVIICAGVIALAVVEHRLSKKEHELDADSKKYSLGALALIFPLLYCLFDTIGTAADGIILEGSSGLDLSEIDVLILYGFTFFIIGLGCYIYMLVRAKKAYNPFKDPTKGIAALFEEFGQIFYVFAMSARPVLAAPMIASYCIVSVILSRVFLKEKLKASQTACVVSVIIGIVMLGISEGIGEL